MTLRHSASDPGIQSGRQHGSTSSLRAAGAGLAGSSSFYPTTNLYDKMKTEGRFRESCPTVKPAGNSITVPLHDSAARDVMPEIYFPVPETPIRERRYRKLSHGPGEIHVHHGLKEQKLPCEDFAYGIRGIKGSTVDDAMKAGQRVGMAEYKNSVAEQKYESTRREPLGKSYIRGHELKMLPEGYGNPSGIPEDAKKVIFPIDQPVDNGDDAHELYKKTHNTYKPGERITREYNWPSEVHGQNFRFGIRQVGHAEGAGMRLAVNGDVEDDGTYKRTRIVPKVCEDYRNVQNPKLFTKGHPKQGATGPPVPVDNRFGIKSAKSEVTAGSCIKGYYSLGEQLPDQDLGLCTKPGRRNVTTETRAFGVPSVRTDIAPPPPNRKSLADMVSYGDDCGVAALVAPQRFDAKGVPDSDYLIRRPKEELRVLIENCGLTVDFERLWDEAESLFEDGRPLVSLDAILYVHCQHIDGRVAQKFQSQALQSSTVAA